MNTYELSVILCISQTIKKHFYKRVNILKEEDLIKDVISHSCEKFTIDDIVSIYPSSNNFGDLDRPPYTLAPADCCGSSSPRSIPIDACKSSDNKELLVELDCQGRLLTINVMLKDVCPNKKISIGVLLLEGTTVKEFKVKEIVTPPVPTGCPENNCQSSVVCEFCFVLPGSICSPITLTPKVIAHYTDFNIGPR